MSTGLHTEDPQKYCDVLTKGTGEGKISLVLGPELVADLGDNYGVAAFALVFIYQFI